MFGLCGKVGVRGLTSVRGRLTAIRLLSVVFTLLALGFQSVRLSMHRSRDRYAVEDTLVCTLLGVRWMYFDKDTLICTLLSVRWMYFDEDTLIRTLLSVRWLYFVGICTLDVT